MRTSLILGLIVLASLAFGACQLLSRGDVATAGSVLPRAQVDGLKCKGIVATLGRNAGADKAIRDDYLATMKCPVSRQASYRYDPGPPARFWCEGTHHQPYFGANQPAWVEGQGVVAGNLTLPPGFPFGVPPGGKLLETQAAQDGSLEVNFSYEGDEAAVLETYKGLGDPVRRPRTGELFLRGKTPTADELTVGIDTANHKVRVHYAPAFLAD